MARAKILGTGVGMVFAMALASGARAASPSDGDSRAVFEDIWVNEGDDLDPSLAHEESDASLVGVDRAPAVVGPATATPKNSSAAAYDEDASRLRVEPGYEIAI